MTKTFYIFCVDASYRVVEKLEQRRPVERGVHSDLYTE
jgi:hypothetical protein